MKQPRHVMMQVVTLLFALMLMGAYQAARAQGSPSGRLAGTVADPTGAVVPGAEVVIKDATTNREYRATTNADGYFLVPSLPVSTYTVTVTATGFKSLVIHSVALSAATPVDLKLTLEPGEIVEQVTVEAGAEVLINRTSETISNTVTGRQIVELPFTSRDALDLALTQPGVATPGRPRTTSINGLPKGAINITFDGINVQDNLLRSSDGFFTYIRPRIDAVEEVTVTTSNPGAASAGEGAVQINFVTKSGSNEWHGGVWWYHRNTALNSNYYFNNQTRQPRQRLLLNQFGWKVGGPIMRDKLFFFYSHDNYRLPGSVSRRRTLFTQAASRGIFTYINQSTNQPQSVDLLALAGANGFPSTIDPRVGELLDMVNEARSLGGVTPVDLFREAITFNNSSSSRRDFPTVRFDYNITEKLHWDGVYHYQFFNTFPDTLNGFDPPFPGFTQAGGQKSNRFALSTSLRATISPTLVNNFRFGLTGGSVGFAAEVGPETFPGGYKINWPNLVSNPLLLVDPSRRNTPVKQWSDNLSWTRGKHNLSFGGNLSLYHSWVEDFNFFFGSAIPEVTFGLDANDPVVQIFNATNFPGINLTTDLATARTLYALLVGRVTEISGGVYVNENTRQYEQGIPLTLRDRHVEYGFYGQDSWRATQNLTLNFGLRWEYQGPPKNTNRIYGDPGFAGLWGISGPGNLFRPGVLEGSPTVYNLVERSFNRDLNNLAPSFGLAWTPDFKNRFLQAIFGQAGQTVLRGGYGITYTREGLLYFNQLMLGPNPGPSAVAQLIVNEDFPAGTLMFNGGQGLPPLKTFPQQFGFPLSQAELQFRGFGPNGYGDNIRIPYVQEWNVSWQREIMRDTVLEFRYVGNHAVKLFRQIDLNEVNIFENGFLQEFNNALINLQINNGQSFAPGRPGTVELPIFTAAFRSTRSPQFRNATFIGMLTSGQAGALALQLANNASFFRNMVDAGYPPNFFVVNPEAISAGNYLLYNGGDSTYHALQIDLRRRLSQGLLVQANYTFSKSLTDMTNVSAVVFQNWRTLRNTGLSKGLSPFDLTHAFKVNYLYEFPFGPGQRWSSGSSVLNKIIGGWATNGIVRMQSGSAFELISGFRTFNANVTGQGGFDSGIVLKGGLTRQQLQKMLKIRKEGNAQIFFFPKELIGPDGRANPEFIDSPRTPGEFGQFIYLHGPPFYRFDLSLVKKTAIGETKDFEFRVEFLNAFNHINFLFGRNAATNSVPGVNINDSTFGQVTNAYQDTSTTDDPGGRIVQFVLRFNF